MKRYIGLACFWASIEVWEDRLELLIRNLSPGLKKQPDILFISMLRASPRNYTTWLTGNACENKKKTRRYCWLFADFFFF